MASVNKIEKLLEKYFEATTTVTEEDELRSYFSQEEVIPHLEEYKPLFNYFSIAKEEKSTQNVSLKSRKKINYLKWISVAAVAALMVGIYFSRQEPPSVYEDFYAQGYSQEEIESAQTALSLLTSNFSKGVQGAAYLEEFEKNTNRFLND